MRTMTAALAAAAMAAATAGGGALATAAPAAAAQVSVYPSPGARTASPQTQLSFRGVAPDAVGALTVVGSASGPHAGRLQAHSDGRGASFLPDAPFQPGETVTVQTGLDVAGARDGRFTLTVATPGPPLRPMRIPPPIVTGAGVQRFHSRHDLVPPKVTVTKDSRAATDGSIVLGTFSAPGGQGPGQIGPMVLDAHGRLVWFHPLKGDELALDVRVQRYQGKPVLTWWQGFNDRGLGNGVGMVFDRSYRRIAVVRGGNGMAIDPHEFLLTPRDTALVAAENPVVWDLSKIGGARRAVVFDAVVQEIDVATGLVLFEWHSLDHVDVAESKARPVRVDGHLYDYFHINSVAETPGGDLLVSARATWGVYKIDRASGAVEWRLGGTRSSFRAASGALFSWQHDARVRPDGTITIFDDGPSPGTGHQSRAIGLRVDVRRRTVRLVHDWRHTPKLFVNTQGNAQTLPGGGMFVGWGNLPRFSEFARHGRLLFDATLPRGTESYRAYRAPWDPAPTTLPAVAASTDRRGVTTVYASWNGAADVARWQLLAGAADDALKVVSTVRRTGFETTVRFRAPRGAKVLAMRALDGRGRALATSAPRPLPAAGR